MAVSQNCKFSQHCSGTSFYWDLHWTTKCRHSSATSILAQASGLSTLFGESLAVSGSLQSGSFWCVSSWQFLFSAGYSTAADPKVGYLSVLANSIALHLGDSVPQAKTTEIKRDPVPFRLETVNKNAPGVTCSSSNIFGKDFFPPVANFELDATRDP